MSQLDWLMIALFFLTLIGIGVYSIFKVRKSGDFFVGGGKLPWWIGGISHHVGGYSAVIFTAWAMYNYRDGFSTYVWWALGFAISCFICGWLIAPKWSEVREKFGVQSPTEYLTIRYGLSTQQIIVWSGVFLKLLDLAGKTVAMATILYGFTGLPLAYGVLLTGIVTLIYNTLGGFFASTRNDVFQFLVQLLGGIFMFVFVLKELMTKHGVNYITMWQTDALQGHFTPLSEECNLFFAIGFGLAIFFGTTGGNWSAGLRFMAAPSGAQARRTAWLSGALYVIWPLIIFAPMWAAPIIFPNLVPEARAEAQAKFQEEILAKAPAEAQDGAQIGTLTKEQSEAQAKAMKKAEAEAQKTVYTRLALDFLPHGFIGIVLASMFAASISTIAGDCNAVTGVISRDIAPHFSQKLLDAEGQTPMWFARTVSFLFAAAVILISLNNSVFGGIVGLVVKWFSGLLGPISVPLIFGLLPTFKRCGVVIANLSVILGIAAFFICEYLAAPLSASLFWPVVTSVVIYCIGVFGKGKPEEEKPEEAPEF